MSHKAGLLIVIFAGVWWTINQSMGATDKGEKQTDDGAVAVLLGSNTAAQKCPNSLSEHMGFNFWHPISMQG